MLKRNDVSTARRVHNTYEDYLRALELSELKLEYCEGEIYARAGGSPTHARLAAAVTRLLGNAVTGQCVVFSSDLKVRIEATDLSTFPDVTVVCGEQEVSSIDRNAIVNPTLLVEVTSHSTEDYDRGEKLNHYKQCPSVRGVVFVSHRRAQLTLMRRTAASPASMSTPASLYVATGDGSAGGRAGIGSAQGNGRRASAARRRCPVRPL